MQETGSPRHMQTLGLRKHLSKLAMDDLLQSERSQVASILSRPTSPGKIEIASTLQPSSPSNDSEDHLSEEPNEAAVEPATLSSTTSGEGSTLPRTVQPSDGGGSFTLPGTMQLEAPADLQTQSVGDVDWDKFFASTSVGRQQENMDTGTGDTTEIIFQSGFDHAFVEFYANKNVEMQAWADFSSSLGFE
ncbi:uncharacterized protein PADG_03935 [Paracoccidioides brasiliensis Pb18]|uniref:Uncharacterized protein n=1 Tax=Paracoccidioides brasiliensis (strain Pb18) TaxID=502780 RepID=C1G9J9_PARBD|nr:uncharacterized protein PADG_03935 [Paracoccidioides brasiliensis Pb18]EEH47851.1 hypothetical protein PADG_03935 [Paracoccidioides brasiliensis Pb18]